MPLQLVISAMPRMGAVDRMELPRLPALDELLRLADADPPDAHWRRGLLRDLGATAWDLPEAVVAACAQPVPAGTGICLAAPAHAVAGLHRVHLHAAGVLSLAAGERAEFASGFAAQFGPEVRLHAGAGQWLLETSCAVAAVDTDPLDWLGAPLERAPASSPQQRALRRLGAEIEMWLADLPLNARRRSRGQLPVNLLWMWGGGQVPEMRDLPVVPAIEVQGDADDAWLAGCARLAGAKVAPLPAAWSSAGAAHRLIVLPAPRDAAQLLELEKQWFAPALADLRAGRIAGFGLRLAARQHRVRAGRLRRLLRRSRPWWQERQA